MTGTCTQIPTRLNCKALTALVLWLFASNIWAETFQLGDLAPRGAPNGQLNAGDLVVMLGIVNGRLAPTPDELIIGDVAPLGAVDETINAADAIVLQRAIFGLISLGTVEIARTPPELNVGAIYVVGSGNLTIVGQDGATDSGTTVTITNLSNGETDTTTSSSNGSFSLPLSGTAGDTLSITVTNGAGLDTTIEYIVRAIQIVSPFNGAMIDDDTVNVYGTFNDAVNTGVMVNNRPACIKGNKFYANKIQLTAGLNTVGAELTYESGVKSSDVVNAWSTGVNNITMEASTDCGVAPLTTTFDIDTQGINVVQFDIDYNGDGTIDSTSPTIPDPSSLIHTYTVGGVYEAEVTITDNTGATHTEKLYIVVQDETEQDTIFQTIWGNMKAQLGAGNRDGALVYVSQDSHYLYGPLFDSFMPNMTEILEDWSNITTIGTGSSIAECAVLSVVDGHVRTFIINFRKDENGVWKIDSM